MTDLESAGDLVFGYGSLAAETDFLPIRDPHPRGWVADLTGHRRVWGVAMDNSIAIPGYKRYVDLETGDPPAVMVAFLDVVPDPDAAVNGVLAPVTAESLDALDDRERNYRRVEVTDRVRPTAPARVWTFKGRPDARERLRSGLATSDAVISRGYLEAVETGFRRLGTGEWERYAASTEDPPCPVRDLRRVDL
ncbi:MAG: gamma-glutamylcyclotransferase family protein [Thermoleophilaceae bacterium]